MSAAWIAELNALGARREPCFFFIRYDATDALIQPCGGERVVQWAFHQPPSHSLALRLTPSPIPFESYQSAFDAVIEEIRAGNTYLLNLTASTPIACNASLEEIYHAASAPYRLWWPGVCVSFSPECFVKIENGVIRTYPMKGTRDASEEGSREALLGDPKELSEHVMVVDLSRNDLGRVAREIRVERFRYAKRVVAGQGALWQTSSEVSGRLDPNWQAHLGEILASLLPAGSITGTPKKRTCEIIQRVEQYERGWFCGVFGVFDGEGVESAVAIRFIEQTPVGLVYKSGGGITIQSDPEREYAEMLRKIYVPVS